ncbi:serine/threonine dehydratase [Desulfonema ishimotonii]|uniref:Serine/threonine dehydratase n=1 Tax=Desulfonema ishimotonii TaxID=45657 RepID=A0A401FS74_9BACT|nr:threo-3-hydroxy-L-aspartate ammonia-lyase [Desulfonema ishimotonii]GBC59814.1 serine/threonine dehydratase [Desulfonema ishimotonii]
MFEKIIAAAQRLEGHAHVTPVMTSRTLSRMVGADVFLKCENFQRIGAFKFRGAYNAMSRLSETEKAKGVLTYSSGNHAQAVALVGQMLNIRTTVVMPDNAPATKRIATEGYGATVVGYDPEKDDREEVARKLGGEDGHTLIPPFDHEEVIAGQGTAALEMFRELGHLDMLLVPCGGGGLLSGSAIAAKGADPACQVIGIEPELADDATRSFHSKTLQTVKNPPTIADGTRTPSLGKLTFPLVLEYADDMKTVSEGAIAEAVRFLFYRMKLVVEPSGALGLAALLSRAVEPGGRIGIILSGGNIDGPTMTKILNA